jgi:hypothetical protein
VGAGRRGKAFRCRSYFLYDRKLLGELSGVTARTVTSFFRATLGEKDLSVGIVSSIRTYGATIYDERFTRRCGYW